RNHLLDLWPQRIVFRLQIEILLVERDGSLALAELAVALADVDEESRQGIGGIAGLELFERLLEFLGGVELLPAPEVLAGAPLASCVVGAGDEQEQDRQDDLHRIPLKGSIRSPPLRSTFCLGAAAGRAFATGRAGSAASVTSNRASRSSSV